MGLAKVDDRRAAAARSATVARAAKRLDTAPSADVKGSM
jgi:hypothetical protein